MKDYKIEEKETLYSLKKKINKKRKTSQKLITSGFFVSMASMGILTGGIINEEDLVKVIGITSLAIASGLMVSGKLDLLTINKKENDIDKVILKYKDSNVNDEKNYVNYVKKYTNEVNKK